MATDGPRGGGARSTGHGGPGHGEPLFGTFFLAGYEGTTAWNVHREWVDAVDATQHDRFADRDYARLRRVGILGARESVRWPLVDRAGTFDFSSLRPLVRAARVNGIRVLYDLFHFGLPEGVHPLDGDFPERFAVYCHAAARWIRDRSEAAPGFAVVNEPSYFAWAAGEVGLFAPHLQGNGRAVKVALARAAIAGIHAVREAFPEAVIVNVDPVCRVVGPQGDEETDVRVREFNEALVFESWDMISGRLLPELGGHPDLLGVLGINYYWMNQWDLTRPGVPLDDDDPRRVCLSDIVTAVWLRYGREVLITETAHAGDRRASWIRELASECLLMKRRGVPLRGACLYPVLGIPEWHRPGEWTHMGLWDLVPDGEGRLRRIAHRPALRELHRAQRALDPGRIHAGDRDRGLQAGEAAR